MIRLLLGSFMPPLREMPEMEHQWEDPCVIDDRHFRERFGTQPEDAGAAVATTLAWARALYTRA